MDRDEAEMKADNVAPISFKKLKTTKSDVSGVGKVHKFVCNLCRKCVPVLKPSTQATKARKQSPTMST